MNCAKVSEENAGPVSVNNHFGSLYCEISY